MARCPDCPQCGNPIPTERFGLSFNRWGHTCETCGALILLRPVVQWEVIEHRKAAPTPEAPDDAA